MTGLSNEEVVKSREKYGTNSLTKKESDKIKLGKRNGKSVPKEFFNKWCPNKVFRYSMLK